jgi:hypothetical protein
MTTDQKFSVLVTILTVGLSAVLAAVGWAIRQLGQGLVRWTRTEDKLGEVVSDLHELVADKKAEHAEIRERLTFLERSELETLRRERNAG